MNNKTKTLYLLRHGEAEFNIETKDFDLSLTENGRQQVYQVAKQLSENMLKIDHLISSSATRARQTIEIIKDHLHLTEIEFRDDLYPCTSSAIFDTIVSLDDSINSVLIVGHNPGLSTFAQEYMQLNEIAMPTSGLISCNYFSDSWAEFVLSDLKRNFFITPKI